MMEPTKQASPVYYLWVFTEWNRFVSEFEVAIIIKNYISYIVLS